MPILSERGWWRHKKTSEPGSVLQRSPGCLDSLCSQCAHTEHRTHRIQTAWSRKEVDAACILVVRSAHQPGFQSKMCSCAARWRVTMHREHKIQTAWSRKASCAPCWRVTMHCRGTRWARWEELRSQTQPTTRPLSFLICTSGKAVKQWSSLKLKQHFIFSFLKCCKTLFSCIKPFYKTVFSISFMRWDTIDRIFSRIPMNIRSRGAPFVFMQWIDLDLQCSVIRGAKCECGSLGKF